MKETVLTFFSPEELPVYVILRAYLPLNGMHAMHRYAVELGIPSNVYGDIWRSKKRRSLDLIFHLVPSICGLLSLPFGRTCSSTNSARVNGFEQTISDRGTDHDHQLVVGTAAELFPR